MVTLIGHLEVCLAVTSSTLPADLPSWRNDRCILHQHRILVPFFYGINSVASAFLSSASPYYSFCCCSRTYVDAGRNALPDWLVFAALFIGSFWLGLPPVSIFSLWPVWSDLVCFDVPASLLLVIDAHGPTKGSVDAVMNPCVTWRRGISWKIERLSASLV